MNGSDLIRLNETSLQIVGCCKLYGLITASFFFNPRHQKPKLGHTVLLHLKKKMIEEVNSKQFQEFIKTILWSYKKTKPGQDSVPPRCMVLTINVNGIFADFTLSLRWFFFPKKVHLPNFSSLWMGCFLVHSAKLYVWCSLTSFLFVLS